MKRYLVSSVVATLLFVLAADAKTFATVNGQDITERDIGEILQVVPGANFEQMTKEQQKQIVDQAIDKKLLAEKALKAGMEKEPEFKEALESIKKDLALELWMKKQFDALTLKESELKDFYNKNSDMFKKPESAKARHILLATEDDAKAVIKELKAAKDVTAKFISLAKEKSTGPSGPSGGELGWFDRKRMVKEFSDAAFALKKGSYTKTPVKTQFGYHVILLEDKKPAQTVSFKEAKPNIEQSLKVEKFQEKMKELSKKLRESADIKIK